MLFAVTLFQAIYANLKPFDAVALCEFDKIEDKVILERLAGSVSSRPNEKLANYSNPLESIFGHFPTLIELTDYAVNLAMVSANNNQSQASRLLGISRQALHKRIKKNSSG